jgi:tRNA(fMet)-specific endonuclease VapC
MAHLAISSVTEAELRYGLARRPDATHLQKIVDEFLLRVTVLPWGSEAARHYGQIRAALEREGQQMGNLDLMIGAHAVALGAVLVTNDQAFRRIKKDQETAHRRLDQALVAPSLRMDRRHPGATSGPTARGWPIQHRQFLAALQVVAYNAPATAPVVGAGPISSAPG